MQEVLKKIPEQHRARFTEIVAITDRFCDQYLDDEYKSLCRDMAATLCRKKTFPITSGPAISWAAGVVSSLGFVNFLGDPAQKPHMIQEEIAKAIGVGASTMAAKAKVIRTSLKLHQMEPRWSRKAMLAHNPLVWMFQEPESGILIDARRSPLPVQKELFRLGMIPYIPDEKGEERHP